MTDIITIPLNRLTLWKGNVRKTGVNDGIGELAASISAHGLLQSLVVREGKRGKYDILAGQRRYLALTALARNGSIGKDHPIPCQHANDDVDAKELSLAENVVRAPMHPADQFEAFRVLIDEGATPTDIAARFGIAETVVAKRLKLGRLSPVLLDAYRNGEIGLEQAQAFAVSDDPSAQERVFADLPEWNLRPDTIREALTAEEIPTSDKRVLFVGVDAYREAGGVLRQDLFCEDGTGYVTDTALLDRLVSEKLNTIRTQVSAEGWRWVEGVADLDWQALSRFSRLHPAHALSDDDQAELDRLTAEYDELSYADDSDDAERLSVLDKRIEELNESGRNWPAETLALASAIVSLDHDGSVSIERGLVRREDLRNAGPELIGDADNDSAPAKRTGLPDRLVEDLTAQKSAAIGAELMGQPEMALVAVVHCLAIRSLYAGCTASSCLELFPRSVSLQSSLAAPDACKGFTAIQQECDRVSDRLPGNPEDLWSWCLERSRDELLDLLAIIAAKAVNAVQRKGDKPDACRLVHANDLAKALKLDTGAWFSPTAENYFNRVSRAQILAAIDEAKGEHAPALDKLKKSDLAVRAESLVAGAGWLPEPLRIAEPDALSEAAG
jgi:ParB family transcriptional regulator, chromosome partitioning protein